MTNIPNGNGYVPPAPDEQGDGGTVTAAERTRSSTEDLQTARLPPKEFPTNIAQQR